MKSILLLTLLVSSLGLSLFFDKGNTTAICLNKQELAFYNQLNRVRQQKGLYKIPLSSDLTLVAQAHAKDLNQNRPDKGACNMHSWSNDGRWSACCYTSDHAKAACMWNKPRELTGYQGNGFEIAYKGSNHGKALIDFLNSKKGHGAVILNRGQWKSMKWKGVGVGVSGQYLLVWFGDAADKKKASLCP